MKFVTNFVDHQTEGGPPYSSPSCLAKEFGYNRELKGFMSISITTDCFHASVAAALRAVQRPCERSKDYKQNLRAMVSQREPGSGKKSQ